MKKKGPFRSGFFHPRILLSLAFCAIGVLLALLAFALYPGATALAQGPQQNQSGVQDQDQAAGEGPFQRQQVDPWTPRPPLQPQYAPDAPTLQLSTTTWTSIGP